MGLLDNIKKVLGIGTETPNSPSNNQPTTPAREVVVEGASSTTFDQRTYDSVIRDAMAELKQRSGYFWGIKINELKSYREVVSLWPDKERIALLIRCCKKVDALGKKAETKGYDAPTHNEIELCVTYVQHLLKAKLIMDDGDVVAIYETFTTCNRNPHVGMVTWPISTFVNQITSQRKGQKISPTVYKALTSLKVKVEDSNSHFPDKDRAKLSAKIGELLEQTGGEADGNKLLKPVLFLGADPLADLANATMAALPPQEQQHWYPMITLAQKASGSKPTAKFLDASKSLITALGSDKFKRIVQGWFEFVTQYKEVITEHRQAYSGREYVYTSYEFLTAINLDTIKGFVWMCAHFHDSLTLQTIAKLAERSFKKIPSHGPACAGLGNACLFVLFKSKGLEGISHLSRLKLRIKQSSTQKMIEKYLTEAAEKQGLTVSEIEEMSVDGFGLENGRRVWKYDEYAFELEILAPGRLQQTWRKPDGSPQKSEPASVKAAHAAKLKKMKLVIKQVEQATTAQRDRIDRLMRSARKMKWEYFQTQYFQHGLLTWFAQRLIWRFEWGSTVRDGIWQAGDGQDIAGEWVDATGASFSPDPQCTVALWHPVMAAVAEIKAWRDSMITQERLQPLKQAFREVYLLTDAEIRTGTYSNRMAAHILRQHQFNSLAKIRGWQYALLGSFDDGRDNEIAILQLPEFGLRVEYWVNPVMDDHAFNATGIWDYVATDQVRFVHPVSHEPIPLIDIPALAFSEAMRDVDLFVGVASVGNDPQWQDSGGIAQYRNYWQTYSFGDLGELAKTRKEILTGIVPRLKIKSVAQVSGNFLVVKGKLRTYKIHIGSDNILMEPNDQYLCIVPDSRAKFSSSQVFLPFEGDSVLSIVLSKAMLLAEDDKITDSTITSQINRQ